MIVLAILLECTDEVLTALLMVDMMMRTVMMETVMTRSLEVVLISSVERCVLWVVYVVDYQCFCGTVWWLFQLHALNESIRYSENAIG